jgi:hypothetical protein
MSLNFTCSCCGKVASSDDEPLHDWLSLTVRNAVEPRRFLDFCSVECLRKYHSVEKDPVVERWWTGLLSLLVWVVLIVAAMASARYCAGAEIKCRWNPNPETFIAGYELSIGTSPGQYSRTVQVGNVTNYTLTDVEGGRLYYLGLVAVSTAGTKSDTAEISHVTKADIPPMDRAGWTATASSAETVREDNKAANALDGNPATLWHTTWGITMPPHYLQLELPRTATLSGLRYLPRQDGGTNGIVTAYEIQTSMDGIEWSASATGTWANDATEKRASLPLTEARFVKLWGNDPRMSASEVSLEGVFTPDPPSTLTLTIQQSPDLSDWSDLSDPPPFTVPLLGKQFFRLKIEPTPPQP